jgi:hypothetical protein
MTVGARATIRVLPLLACAVAFACGSERAAAPPPPADPEALVLRVERSGGLEPPGGRINRVPEFSLYGDGRAIVPAAPRVPAPAVPRLRVRTVSGAGIERMLAAAGEAGLLDGADFGAPSIPDASTTTIVAETEGRRHVTEVVALAEATGSDPALTAAQVEARERLRAFVAQLQRPEDVVGRRNVGRARPYRARALAVFATEAAGAAGPAERWPLRDLASAGVARAGGRCQVLRGTRLRTVRRVLEGATAQTPWRSGGRAYHLQFRPLLPGERRCGDVTS